MGDENRKSTSSSLDLFKYADGFIKIATVVALISVAALGAKFVSREEFNEELVNLTSRVSKIEEVLIRMEANYETDKRHDQALNDHENRIRILESRVRGGVNN